MPLTARITNISRCSMHDGPGIRTVVYFKGCGLRCRWCHNPETFSIEPEVLYIPVKCIHCGQCVDICPEHHIVVGNEMVFRREDCVKCEKCIEACPSGALSMSGEAMTVEKVLKEVVKDRAYYDSTGGGVTLSGGECLLQAEFAAELLKRCQEEGIHTAIETALFVPWEAVERVIPHVDFVFADMKLADGQKHRVFTRRSNERIMENLQRLTGLHGHVVVRIPVIPGVNDSVEDMAAFARALDQLGDGAKEVELLRYNHLAEAKYGLVGMRYEAFSDAPQPEEEMQRLQAVLTGEMQRKRRVFYRM